MAVDYSNIISNATTAYNNTLAGYKNQLAQQQQQQQGVMQGYNTLQANVLKGLEGNSAAARQDIIDQYTNEAGKQQLALNARGLGNTTIVNSIGRGLQYDQAKAQTNRLNQFANTAAGYQTQLGLAGLGYQGNALNANAQFAGQGLQYQGQGAAQIGNLAQGFAGLENQKAMQDAQLAQQLKLEKLHLYGAGGNVSGGGGSSGSIPGLGGAMQYPNNAGSVSYGGYGGHAPVMVPNPNAQQNQPATYGGDLSPATQAYAGTPYYTDPYGVLGGAYGASGVNTSGGEDLPSAIGEEE